MAIKKAANVDNVTAFFIAILTELINQIPLFYQID